MEWLFDSQRVFASFFIALIKPFFLRFCFFWLDLASTFVVISHQLTNLRFGLELALVLEDDNCGEKKWAVCFVFFFLGVTGLIA